MMTKHDWLNIIAKISQAAKILLTTHHNPDGDGLGAEAALYNCFKRLGKSPYILNSSVLPPEYVFLNEDGIFNTYRAGQDISELADYDLLMILDAGSTDRLGALGPALNALNLATICIDHHPFNNCPAGNTSVIDEHAPATAILIYELIKAMAPQTIDIKIAEALYTGLMTDTGSFRFENTTAETMLTAAEFLKYGIQPGLIYRYVYENYRPERMKLLGMVLQNVQYEFNNQLAWFSVTREQVAAAETVLDEVDGFTDFIRSIKGVEVAVMFLEVRANLIRMNFRSKGRYPINAIARQFGGGGHPFAAGLVMEVGLTEAIKTVMPAVRTIFQPEDKS
ncbi:MAG: bifunctional oligoribonuclease/PAP phosphatase NrnA [Candidatus Marinimicrobia bacterium]|nr:bifunctional oligoribonuclease/PAP phosphatase NrnA [Candidatus Neomarinimicrobiota bacterium]